MNPLVYLRRPGACSVAILTFVLGGLCLTNAAPAPTDPRLEWWRDARFGLFIHWGPGSLKGTEIGWARGGGGGGPGARGSQSRAGLQSARDKGERRKDHHPAHPVSPRRGEGPGRRLPRGGPAFRFLLLAAELAASRRLYARPPRPLPRLPQAT